MASHEVAEEEDLRGAEAPVEAGQVGFLSSLVLETDDLAESGPATLQGEERPPARHRKSEIVDSARASTVIPRSSGSTWPAESTQEPRHSVANAVATEVTTFFDVFGLLGIPMIIVFMLSAAWTFMLAVIQVHADSMANAIMNTTEFDNGNFWLLPKPDTAIVVSSTVILGLFGAGYTGLVIIMLFYYRGGGTNKGNHHPPTAAPSASVINTSTATVASESGRKNYLQVLISWVRDLPVEIRQHYYTAALDLPKLIFQTITLYTYLDKGFPLTIIYIYSVLLLFNWLMVSYRNQRYVADPALIIARLYYTFDLFFAVFAPLVVLVYFINSFEFDRAAFLTKTETLSAGTFDTVARLYGDPSQISSFCNAFHYLQFSSGSTLFYKSALNLLSLYKWRKIIFTLIHNHHERQLERKRKALVGPTLRCPADTESFRASVKRKFAVSKPKFGKHFVLKAVLSLFFFLAGVGNFVYSIGAIESTNDVCSSYSKCVVRSYHWNFGEEYCTCLVFADRQTAPATYAEWTNPEDTIGDLAALARAGQLRIIQIINHALPELPEELRGCHHLEQLILAYTKTNRLPEWLSEFSHLEYIHIEGDYTSRRLTTIPDGIFDNMPHLTFLHLGGIPNVTSLPSLSSLTSLRYLTLAILDSLPEIPSFEGLSAVSNLNIVNAPLITTLPSLAPLVSLTSLGIRPKSGICCNGFISGTCDLTMAQCLPVASDKFTLSCTDERISDEDKAVVDSFGSSICPNGAAVDREATAPSKYTTDELCGGVLYKNCTLSGEQGICYNTRMMVITCETTSGYIAMRKLQIERGVGDPCDPDVEAWLGCTA